MFAIIETGSKQYKVSKGTIIDIEKTEADSKGALTFNKVLLISEEAETKIGQPTVEGAKVTAKVLENFRDKKKIVFKFKKKTGYKVKNGHRQSLTRIQITGIEAGTKKAATTTTSEKES